MKGFVYDSVLGIFAGMRSGFFKPLIGILAIILGYAAYALPCGSELWVFLEWVLALMLALGGWSELLGVFGFGMSILFMIALGIALFCYILGENDKVNWFILWGLSVVYYIPILGYIHSIPQCNQPKNA